MRPSLLAPALAAARGSAHAPIPSRPAGACRGAGGVPGGQRRRRAPGAPPGRGLSGRLLPAGTLRVLPVGDGPPALPAAAALQVARPPAPL